MTAPDWASVIARLELGQDGPKLTWRRTRQGHGSTGRAFPKGGGLTGFDGPRFVVTATTSRPRWEQKLVLLHEIAHMKVDPDEHHSLAFWVEAWTLYRRYGLPLRKVLAREKAYRKLAIEGYRLTRPSAMTITYPEDASLVASLVRP